MATLNSLVGGCVQLCVDTFISTCQLHSNGNTARKIRVLNGHLEIGQNGGVGGGEIEISHGAMIPQAKVATAFHQRADAEAPLAA